jgi:hypothetical protein
MEAIDLRLATQRFHPSRAGEKSLRGKFARHIGYITHPTQPVKVDLTANSLPSVLPLVRFHRYESLHCALLSRRNLCPPGRPGGEPNLTLGGDKPVIPGVAFIR